MNSHFAVICLISGSLWGLVAGCGKSESPAPTTKQNDQSSSVTKAELTATADKLVAQATNAAAAKAEAAKSTLDSAAKSADAAAKATLDKANNADAAARDTAKSTLVNATKAADAATAPIPQAAPPTARDTKPSSDQPPTAAAPAPTSLASLSQDQVVLGLKDALG